METRTERQKLFNPEKLDLVKLVEELDWTKSISLVDLVKTVNKSEKLRGREKYMANAESGKALSKYFEKKVSECIEVVPNGKDRLYTLKPGLTKEQLIHFAKTGEKNKEIKEELKKKDSKYYIPEVPESWPSEEKPKKLAKRVFPDNEVLAKTAIILYYIWKGKGTMLASKFNEIREGFGWKYQRSIEGTAYTGYLEANRFCSEYFKIESPVSVGKNSDKLTTYKWTNSEAFKNIVDNIKMTISLMDDETLKEKVTKIVKLEEEPKPEEKKEEVIVKPEETKTETVKQEKTETMERPTEETKRPKIVKASPVVGKSEYRELGTTSPTIYEGSRVRWTKSLIAATFKGAARGTWLGFNDIANIIKKTRYVEISLKEIKETCQDIGRDFKGIFREIEFGGLTIGSEAMVKDLINTYAQEKITETIFVRLRMSLSEIEETYPELKVKVASRITDDDNIYEIEMNRSERTEKAFARLVYRMRRGEIILESVNNWVVKRTKVIIERCTDF